MRKSDPLKWGGGGHYPKTEEGWEELGKRVATVHTTLYISCQFLKSLPIRSMLMTFSTCASASSQV